MKKLLYLVVISSLLFLGISPVYADVQSEKGVVELKISNDVEPTKFVSIYSKTDDEVNIELRNQIDNEVNKIIQPDNGNLLRSGSAHGGSQWKTEYGAVATKVAGGYAGNQVPGGYRFPTGGGFYYSDSGGPSVTVSFNFANPFGILGIGVPLGNKGSKGVFVNVPTTTKYYKLYILKTIKAQPFIVYNKVNGQWKVYSRGIASSVQKVAFDARAV